MRYKGAKKFNPETRKGKTKIINTKREWPFRTVSLLVSPVPGHFNWVLDNIR
jgi:hypothetical protein